VVWRIEKGVASIYSCEDVCGSVDEVVHGDVATGEE
jgi:hypothetical protein